MHASDVALLNWRDKMNARKICLFLLLLISVPCFAQTTATLTGTVTDSDSQTWNNATDTFNLYNPYGTRPVVCSTGVPVPLQVVVTLDGTGTFSGTIIKNNAICPAGTTWTQIIQSDTSAPPVVLPTQNITTNTYNAGAFASANIIAPRFYANIFGAFGYNISEPLPNPCVIYNTWFDVVTLQQLTCNGTSYIAGSLLLTTNGVNNGNQQHLNFKDTATVTWANSGADEMATAAGGGILPPNPSTTNYVVVGDSRNLVDTSNVTSPITVTAASCTITICTMTATNTLVTGDVIAINTTFSPSFLSGGGVGTNPYFYVVLSSGLSSSQFEIANPVGTAGSGTGGNVLFSDYLWPFQAAKLPYFNGHGTMQVVAPTSGETVAGIIAQYTTFIHPFSPVVTGNPGFLLSEVGYANTLTAACGSMPSSDQTDYQTLWAMAHADGFQSGAIFHSTKRDGWHRNLWTPITGSGSLV